MRSIAETTYFAKEVLRLFREAAEIVELIPSAQDQLLRCHEVARVVAAMLNKPNIKVVDGRYGIVDHSWLMLGDEYLLDVYAVGRLPMVQIRDVRTPTLPRPVEYFPGPPRSDIQTAVVAELLARLSPTLETKPAPKPSPPASEAARIKAKHLGQLKRLIMRAASGLTSTQLGAFLKPYYSGYDYRRSPKGDSAEALALWLMGMDPHAGDDDMTSMHGRKLSPHPPVQAEVDAMVDAIHAAVLKAPPPKPRQRKSPSRPSARIEAHEI